MTTHPPFGPLAGPRPVRLRQGTELSCASWLIKRHGPAPMLQGVHKNRGGPASLI